MQLHCPYKRKTEGDDREKRISDVTVDAETVVMQPRVKQCQQRPAAGRIPAEEA